MAKIHAIKHRIRSVAKVGQITKAMEKVAASKMRRAQAATLRSRTYAASAWEILQRLYQMTPSSYHELFAKRVGPNRLLILFSSDRGLAGAYNSNLFKLFLAELKDRQPAPQVIVIGRKGADFLSRLGNAARVIGVYADLYAEPTIADVQPITQTAIRLFTERAVDKVELIYTDFIPAARQEVPRRTLLPLGTSTREALIGQNLQETTFEPAPAAVLKYVIPRILEVQVYQAALEALASEHSMRMVAMKNASDNAEELSDDLTLLYNRARQGTITQELAEITAGAEAIT